jgi:hypothetical protein
VDASTDCSTANAARFAPIWSYRKYATSGVFEQAAVNVHEFVIDGALASHPLILQSANGRSCSSTRTSRVESLPAASTLARHAREATGELCDQYSAS